MNQKEGGALVPREAGRQGSEEFGWAVCGEQGALLHPAFELLIVDLVWAGLQIGQEKPHTGKQTSLFKNFDPILSVPFFIFEFILFYFNFILF